MSLSHNFNDIDDFIAHLNSQLQHHAHPEKAKAIFSSELTDFAYNYFTIDRQKKRIASLKTSEEKVALIENLLAQYYSNRSQLEYFNISTNDFLQEIKEWQTFYQKMAELHDKFDWENIKLKLKGLDPEAGIAFLDSIIKECQNFLHLNKNCYHDKFNLNHGCIKKCEREKKRLEQKMIDSLKKEVKVLSDKSPFCKQTCKINWDGTIGQLLYLFEELKSQDFLPTSFNCQNEIKSHFLIKNNQTGEYQVPNNLKRAQLNYANNKNGKPKRGREIDTAIKKVKHQIG